MPNSLSLSVLGKSGVDFAGVFSDLAGGLFSQSGSATGDAGTALMTDAGTMELRIDYVTIGGEIHATGLSLSDGGTVVATGSFSSPEPLGFAAWASAPDPIFDALLGDTAITVNGKSGDDWASGSVFDDTFNMKGGDNAASGGAGDDIMRGGSGMDLLMGGADDDRLLGGANADMLICGPGDDFANGGSGNDVLVFQGSGTNSALGGLGDDIFIFDSFNSSAGGSPNVLRTTVRDLDPGDLLLFCSFDGTLPATVEGTTLADLENGTIDEFRWVEKANGVLIRAGDSRVLLRGLTADEVDLDMVLFAEQSAADTVELFDSASAGGTLGTPPGGDPYLTITMTNATRVGNGDDLIETYGGDILDFSSSAGGSPNV